MTKNIAIDIEPFEDHSEESRERQHLEALAGMIDDLIVAEEGEEYCAKLEADRIIKVAIVLACIREWFWAEPVQVKWIVGKKCPICKHAVGQD